MKTASGRGLSLVLALLLTAPALAWQTLLPQARLIGEGKFSQFGFTVYHARLWSASAPVDGSRPFALQLRYRLSISREQFIERSLEEIERVRPGALDEPTRQRWTGWMQQAFVDVKSGEELTGVFLPGQGARFYHGARLTAAIDDPVFAAAFFDIWLSPRTRDSRLRDRLLGNGS